MAETWSLNVLLVRHGLAVRAAAVAALTAVLLIFAVIPLVNAIDRGLTQVGAKQQQANDLTDKVTILTGLDPNVLANRVMTLDAALPPRKDILLYLSSLDGLSRDLNLNFGGIALAPGELTPTAGQTKATPGLHSLDTTVKISGSGENIYAFLRTVEQTLPLMLIKNVKVDVAGADAYGLTLNLGMLWADPGVGNVNGPITLFTDKEQAYFTTLQGYHQYQTLTSAPVATGAATTGPRDLFTP